MPDYHACNRPKPQRTRRSTVRVRFALTSATGAVAAALCMLGCSSSEFHIEVSAHHPDHSALANLEITALPFDRDALRDSLAAAIGDPRPEFPDLAAELEGFSPPDITGFDESIIPWQAIRDSVEHLADSLIRAGADGSHGYAQAYARLREQYRRLAASAVDRDESIRERFGKHTQLAARAAAAADVLRAWEGTAFSSFPELAESVMNATGKRVHIATTDTGGIAGFVLQPGRWWFVASTVDPDNPFKEYYWNVAVVVGRWGSRSVPIFDGNGVSRWRY